MAKWSDYRVSVDPINSGYTAGVFIVFYLLLGWFLGWYYSVWDAVIIATIAGIVFEIIVKHLLPQTLAW